MTFKLHSLRGNIPQIILVKNWTEEASSRKIVATSCDHAAQKVMAESGFPENVRQFVFEHIDSVEQLEVLLFVRAHRGESHDTRKISAELRSNPASVLKRLLALEQSGFVRNLNPGSKSDESALFQYDAKSNEIDTAIGTLADLYKSRPQKIFEIIFSPLKKGRQFARAFVVKTKKDTDNG